MNENWVFAFTKTSRDEDHIETFSVDQNQKRYSRKNNL